MSGLEAPGPGPGRRLRLGVIGAGAWAQFAHIPGLLRRPEVEPLIVCRRDPSALAQVRDRFGFAHGTPDWREVIDARPDIVALTGPGASRAEQALAALEAGAHVLAEKPFTLAPADAWAIERLARDRGRHVVLCYAWNEMGIARAARDLVAGAAGVGEIEHVGVLMSTIVRDLLTVGTTYLGDADVPLPRTETWQDPALSGGGYGQAQLTHVLGLLLYLTGLRPAEVAAFTGSAGAPVELHDALALRFTNGAVGTVGGTSMPLGSFGNEHQVTIRITGRRGQVLLDLAPPRVHRSLGGVDTVADLDAEDVRWSFDRVTDRLVDLALGLTAENPSPASLGAQVVDILDAMYRSAATGAVARISPG